METLTEIAVEKLLKEHQPQKSSLSLVHDLLKEWYNLEHLLYRAICTKYGVAPALPFRADAQEWARCEDCQSTMQMQELIRTGRTDVLAFANNPTVDIKKMSVY